MCKLVLKSAQVTGGMGKGEADNEICQVMSDKYGRFLLKSQEKLNRKLGVVYSEASS